MRAKNREVIWDDLNTLRGVEEVGQLTEAGFIPGKSLGGWTRYDHTTNSEHPEEVFFDEKSNYRATLFTRNGEAILVYDMTEGLHFQDLRENVGQGGLQGLAFQLGLAKDPVSPQYRLAEKAAAYFKEKCKQEGKKLRLAGYSKGGGMAMFAGLKHEIEFISFSPAGLSESTQKDVGKDKLHKANSLGKVIFVKRDSIGDPESGFNRLGNKISGIQVFGQCYGYESHLPQKLRKAVAPISQRGAGIAALFAGTFEFLLNHHPKAFHPSVTISGVSQRAPSQHTVEAPSNTSSRVWKIARSCLAIVDRELQHPVRDVEVRGSRRKKPCPNQPMPGPGYVQGPSNAVISEKIIRLK